MQYAAESRISAYVPDAVVGMNATSGGSSDTAVKVPDDHADRLPVGGRARDDGDAGRVVAEHLPVVCGVDGGEPRSSHGFSPDHDFHHEFFQFRHAVL